MTNQISCQKLPYKSYFGTNIQESHIFGLEPNYGCCTADHTQGWPKLAASLFMKSRFGIVNTIMLPSSVETKIKGSNVKISIETEYPFRLCGKYTVSVEKETEFELKIRVPNYVMNIYVDGKEYKKTDYIKIKKLWNGEITILVEYKTIPKIVKRPYGMFAVEYGPLVFALPIETEYVMREYELGGVERKYPYCDYDLLPKSEWRYAFAGSDFTVVECDGDDVPFSSVAPRIKLSAILARINWEYEEGYCDIAKYKASPDPISDPETIMLHPYGCAKLRVTEMPFIKTK